VVYVGTSGWQYRDWRGSFYPVDVPQREWLEWYCRHFRTVELNKSFYNLPEASVFGRWRERARDVYVYFNNDHHGCAVRDAGDFARLCREVGLEPMPVTAAVTVGGYSRR
jgi:uncharacterized protein YecE (DUF72 family)